MAILYLVLAFLQSLGVSFGIGSSTLAVASYIVAAKDGNVDESERRLMRIVYTMLRVAMVTILVTMVGQAVMLYVANGTYTVHPFVMTAWTVVLVLFLNAILMTLHHMPRFLGPALQAGSWYTLGILYFLSTVGLVNYSYTQFFTLYLSVVVIAVIAINGSLAFFKTRV